jgi:hypothetical protein
MNAAAKEPRDGSAHVLMAAINNRGATASIAYGDFRLTLLAVLGGLRA